MADSILQDLTGISLPVVGTDVLPLARGTDPLTKATVADLVIAQSQVTNLTSDLAAKVATGGELGTPSSGTLTNCTGLPVASGVSGLGTGVATFLATPSSANLASAVTDETGTGALVFANTPTLTTPNIGAATGTGLQATSSAGVSLKNNSGTETILTGAGGGTGTTLRGGLVVEGTVTAGSGPTTLTDSAGKVLSAALNTVAVGQGGTGATTLTGLVKGNGTSAFTAASAGTDYVAPGAATGSGLTMATSRLLGRTTASTGAIEEISIGSGLSLSAGSLSATGGGGWTTGILFRNTSSTEIINNSAAETSCFPGATKTIPGGTLGTTGVVKFSINGQLTNSTGGNVTFTLKVLFGGTTYFQDATANIGSNANPRAFRIDGELSADNSTSAQRLTGIIWIAPAGTVTTGYGDLGSAGSILYGNGFGGTPTEDSTADKTFDVTITASTANASYTVRVHSAYVQKV